MTIQIHITRLRLTLLLVFIASIVVLAQTEVLRVDKLITTGDADVTGIVLATQFTDRNNTARFVNPSGDSQLGTATFGTFTSGTADITNFLYGNTLLFNTGGSVAGSPIWKPGVDNTGSLGQADTRWNLIRGVTITSGDLVFENGWTLTESYKVGVADPGLAILDETGDLVLFIGKSGIEPGANKSYVKTSPEQRQWILKEPKSGYLTPPDPTDARPGGVAVDKRPIPQKLPTKQFIRTVPKIKR